MLQTQTPVLIVGGGIVGLTASLLLSQYGVRSLLIERHAGTSIHPRARGVNARTMEIYRSLGLEEKIREVGKELQPALGSIKGATLREALEEFVPTQHLQSVSVLAWTEQILEMSPTKPSRGTQDLVEPILLQEARKRGSTVSFSTELLSFTQDEQGVTARVRDRMSGEESTIRATYMIGADGANSSVVRVLGIASSEGKEFGHVLNILFHADLRRFVEGKEFSQCLIERPDMVGVLLSINNSDRWTFQLAYHPERGERSEDYSHERCQALLTQAIGLPNVEVEVKSILPWTARACIADTLQQGRIFLAGDAAHQVTPWSGLGANTGVADVHNLAWKLATVLNGSAGPALLNTYTSERRPVGVTAVRFAYTQTDEDGLASRERYERDSTYTSAMLSGPGAQVVRGYGYKYISQAILSEQGADSENADINGQPGTRVPHLWLSHKGERLSTIDLASGGFVLLTGPDGDAWGDAARVAAAQLHIELKVYRIASNSEFSDPEQLWAERAGIHTDGVLLVRPDGIVAWRSKTTVAEPQRLLEQVFSDLLVKEQARFGKE